MYYFRFKLYLHSVLNPNLFSSTVPMYVKTFTVRVPHLLLPELFIKILVVRIRIDLPLQMNTLEIVFEWWFMLMEKNILFHQIYAFLQMVRYRRSL